MNTASTFQLNDSEFVSKQWVDNYPPAPSETSREPITDHKSAKTSNGSTINLHWAHDQQLVLLPANNFYTRVGKRVVDVIIAGLVTVLVLSWLIPIIGALILCESPGPFFFVQARSGRKGRPFACLKFRTMRHATRAEIFQQTLRDDARVTPIGRFLRRTNLDEMPQFLNVLLGDMSLVGPRPHAIQHDAMHWDSAAYRERYWVRPGITGLAQVRGARGATGALQQMNHRVKYDHFYIPRQTFLLDMKICVRTLRLMVKGDVNAW